MGNTVTAPTVASYNTNQLYGVNSSITVTKPTGLEAGDVLVAYIITGDGSGHTINTPTNWTSVYASSQSAYRRYKAMYKVADSSDASASNFSFTTDAAVSYIGAILVRVTGVPVGSEIRGTYGDKDIDGNTTASFAPAITPLFENSLVLAGFGGHDEGSNFGSYASTPTMTWTEVTDLTYNYSTLDPTISCAWAVTANTTQITAFQATSGSAGTFYGTLIVFNPVSNSTATPTMLPQPPTINPATPTVSVARSATLLQNTGTIPTPTSATSAKKWTNTPKNVVSSVTNTPKS